jgi:hypothetical protein
LLRFFRYDCDTNFETWKAKFLDGGNVWNIFFDTSEIPLSATPILEAAYKRYGQLLESQDFVLTSDNERTYFERIFAAFPDIRNIKVGGSCPQDPIKSASWHTSLGTERLFDPEYARQTHRLGRQTLVLPLMHWREYHEEIFFFTSVMLPSPVLEAIDYAGLSLRKIDVSGFRMDQLLGCMGP